MDDTRIDPKDDYGDVLTPHQQLRGPCDEHRGARLLKLESLGDSRNAAGQNIEALAKCR